MEITEPDVGRIIEGSGAANFPRQVDETTDGNGFDAAIEAVGLPSTFQNCVGATAFGGRVVLIGVGKANLDFDFTTIRKRNSRFLAPATRQRQTFCRQLHT